MIFNRSTNSTCAYWRPLSLAAAVLFLVGCGEKRVVYAERDRENLETLAEYAQFIDKRCTRIERKIDKLVKDERLRSGELPLAEGAESYE
jgi:hypothetical protein